MMTIEEISEDKQLLIDVPIIIVQKRKRNAILTRYCFFICINVCMIIAFFTSNYGGTKGLIDGNLVIWNFAIPLIYLETGYQCSLKALGSAVRNGYLISFVLIFVYLLIPSLARIGTIILSCLGVNIRLLKGIEVLHCLPPPLSTSLVLSKIANADLATSVVTILTCHFSGLILTPILLHTMMGAVVRAVVPVQTAVSTVLPLMAGILLQKLIPKRQQFCENRSNLLSVGVLLIIAYNLFCDAFSMDAASLLPADILLTVFIACISQTIIVGICWMLCNNWLSQDVLLATIFTSTYKSIGFGEWLAKTAFHNSDIQGPALNLPLGILTVAQLLFGSLMASWLAPS